jgi:hypothetical protein
MTDDNNTVIDAIQIDEEILSYTVSDEALEAAAGESYLTTTGISCHPYCP